MRGYKPNQAMWAKVNQAILDENAAEVLVTLISGMQAILVSSGVATSERQARVALAAMLLSPDDGPVGSLQSELAAEFKKLNDGKWLI